MDLLDPGGIAPTVERRLSVLLLPLVVLALGLFVFWPKPDGGGSTGQPVSNPRDERGGGRVARGPE